jgi:hypothetical protein
MDPMHEKRERRSNQRFTAEIRAYAASLTNGSGKTPTPETIVVGKGNEI